MVLDCGSEGDTEEETWKGRKQHTLVVINTPPYFLRRNKQRPHLPDRHLEVHLRKLEQALEEAWHAQTLLSPA